MKWKHRTPRYNETFEVHTEQLSHWGSEIRIRGLDRRNRFHS
jgi:hypothetical protein